MGIPLAASWPEWLTAIGGVGAFGATVALAFLAFNQIGAARDQVEIMRKSAADDARTVREQIEASIAQGDAIRKAARAQLQPVVFAHPERIISGPNDEFSLSAEVSGFGYRLKNEGTGIALKIRHGVEIDGKKVEFGEGMQSRALRPGEAQPPFDYLDAGGHEIHFRPLVVKFDARSLPSDWSAATRVYWASFENVFGERFETRNPSDPRQSATFTRL